MTAKGDMLPSSAAVAMGSEGRWRIGERSIGGSTRRGSSLSPTVGPQAGRFVERTALGNQENRGRHAGMGGAGRIICPKLQPGARN